ncbi:uridine kinase family protein [Mesobacillus subterraneus]|uniref:Uridine kinase n=1 Tax=Mesobacillus subterraneus TaxID=285983 RepID=A0A3R9FXY3_9BACI|nr:AAA family ATPase [Mesobacillus subterraneus]RSD27689.1 uridine kinase [Mesobacillus subterraneus]
MNQIDQCVVIGIAGGSGSGKTTFCHKVAKTLSGFKVKTIATDDYFLEKKTIVKALYSNRCYEEYDHPSSVNIRKLEYEVNRSIASKQFDVVMIEGLMVLYFENIREQLDLKIFIDCPADERLVRRLRRDMGEETFEEISSEYLDIVRHRHKEFVEPTKWHADLIINGSNTSETSINVVCKWVMNNI